MQPPSPGRGAATRTSPIEPGETDQFKYIVFHAMDRDGFCSPLTTGAVLLHPVLSGAANDTFNGGPAETVDFLIDSGEGIIIGSSNGRNDGLTTASSSLPASRRSRPR